ncbi:MAG: molybdopterin-dependent oxidoreductase, partial [Luteitalea sp.]|nr:molybdopterin-dependent oxidoreductase [Luteitalea sp.]
MSESPKQYWMSVVERDSPGERSREAENGDPDFAPTRRSFLKAAGFSIGALAAASCRAPEIESIPYVRQPEGIVPGRPLSYATTCAACEARCGLLVTNRDGRPVKIEGNPDHPLSGGSTCAVGQASILGLYDSQRLQHPTNAGQPAAWPDVDREIMAALERTMQEGRAVRILTSTVTSPTMAAVIADFVSGFPGARHVTYDPIAASALLDAHQQTHGVRLLPQYRFDRADVIVSFDADFLGTWISPVQFTRGYASKRRIAPASVPGAAPSKSYHVQIESRLSLTGSNADRRLRVAPGEVGHLATHLAARLAERAGAVFSTDGLSPSPWEPVLADVAERLWQARGRGLVISGSQDQRVQALCHMMNETIGAYGTTVDSSRPSYQRAGSDVELAALRAELSRNQVGALFIVGANPVYDLPDGAALVTELQRVPLVVSTAERVDETAAVAHFVCPDHHYLESWGDAEPVSGVVSLSQPVIEPLYQTRPAIESLAAWAGKPQSAAELVRAHWAAAVHPRAADDVAPFDPFWDRT